METITIPYEKFEELLDKASMLDAITNDICYLISESELNYKKDDLDLDSSIREFAKKYCSNRYEKKFKELIRESESENNE